MDRKRNLLRVAVVGLLASVPALGGALPASSESATTAPELTLPLSVQGNRVVDATGATVVLRGLQRDGIQGGSGSSTKPVTATELDALGFRQPGSWHATVVRVPLGSAQWTGACPKLAGTPAAYRGYVDSVVGALTAQGVVALLDLHTSTAGCTSIGRHAMPDAPVTQQFWSDVATHYAPNPLVAFELYNEPHYVSDLTWLSGSTSATVQDCDVTVALSTNPVVRTQQQMTLARCQAAAPKYKAAGMQELYNLVTAKAPGHLVVVDGPAWAALPSTKPVIPTAPNLVHGVHPYTCSTAGASCDTTSNAVANVNLLDKWKTLAAVAPVLVTEMGWPVYPKSDGTGYVNGAGYYQQTLAYLQAQTPQWGFVAFAFDGTATGAFSLVTSTSTFAPNSTGQPVYDLLRSVA